MSSGALTPSILASSLTRPHAVYNAPQMKNKNLLIDKPAFPKVPKRSHHALLLADQLAAGNGGGPSHVPQIQSMCQEQLRKRFISASAARAQVSDVPVKILQSSILHQCAQTGASAWPMQLVASLS